MVTIIKWKTWKRWNIYSWCGEIKWKEWPTINRRFPAISLSFLRISFLLLSVVFVSSVTVPPFAPPSKRDMDTYVHCSVAWEKTCMVMLYIHIFKTFEENHSYWFYFFNRLLSPWSLLPWRNCSLKLKCPIFTLHSAIFYRWVISLWFRWESRMNDTMMQQAEGDIRNIDGG